MYLWCLPKVAAEVKPGTTLDAILNKVVGDAIDATCPGNSGDAMRAAFGFYGEGGVLAARAILNKDMDFWEARRLVDGEYIPRIAAWLCQGAANSFAERLPDVTELETALDDLCMKGLPLTRDRVTLTLVAFLPLAANSSSSTQNAMAADRFLKAQLEVFEIDELRQAAHVLFAHAPGTKGTTLKRRYEVMAEISEGRYGTEHARQKIRPQIITALAWQIYRFKAADLAGENEGAPTNGGGSPEWQAWSTGRTLRP
ncbi:hypothetical protein GCM10018980_40080 [Streptomyces capoamus]|uniref:Uncharacterized protein n=1 Tax=Streptomyces capoamus TaxID=68183 RepID=A0A919EX91_9ACTN|nr:hypothetical protein GCM10018980_40080 [Streptomyces capoamus]